MCIKAPASSRNCLFLIFLSFLLPYPVFPDTDPHEIYTAFKFLVNEEYVSLGLPGIMVKISQ